MMGSLNPLTSGIEILLLTFDSDEPAIMFQAGDTRRSASAKWIDNQIAGVAVCPYQPFH